MKNNIDTKKVTEKLKHFKDFHFENSICVNMDSSEKCIYVLGRRFWISRAIAAAINENGEMIPLKLDNITIAVKPKYSEDFVGYLNIGEYCIKVSPKSPYEYNHSFIFAFICDNAIAASVLLTKPVSPNANLSGLSVDIGLNDSNILNNYNKVVESISAILSLIKSTALRDVKSDTAFVKMFERSDTLLPKSSDETLQIAKQKEDNRYD